jgi:carbamoylphosphate synthase large subunit
MWDKNFRNECIEARMTNYFFFLIQAYENKRELVRYPSNACLSQSSVLASKTAGYPLALVAAKLGLGDPARRNQNSVHESHLRML